MNFWNKIKNKKKHRQIKNSDRSDIIIVDNNNNNNDNNDNFKNFYSSPIINQSQELQFELVLKEERKEHNNNKRSSQTFIFNPYSCYNPPKLPNLSSSPDSLNTSFTTISSIATIATSNGMKSSLEDLPTEIIIKIFELLVEPTDCIRVWRDNYYIKNNNHNKDISFDDFDNEIIYSRDQWLAAENQRRNLRLTCRTWNYILLELLTQMEVDLYRTNKHGLENCVSCPKNLKKLSIYNTRFSNKNTGLNTGVDQWLSKYVSQLQSLSIKDCPYLTINGLSSLPNSLIELKIIHCPKITPDVLITVLKSLPNLNHLTLNTNQFFIDPSFSKNIENLLPNLTSLHVVIPCNINDIDIHSHKSQITITTSDDTVIIKQNIPPNSFPNNIKELILSQDLPQKKHRILTEEDYEQMGPNNGSPLNVRYVLVLDNPMVYPSSLERLNVSKCFFDNNLFALPSSSDRTSSTLTHLSASYPSLPQGYDTIGLPSTLEYLNVMGFVYHFAYESASHYTYHTYGGKWINLLPRNAESLHTLILHLYTYKPENLYSLISSRYSKSLRKLDCSTCYSGITGFENDSCLCERKCFQGQCYRRQMVKSLTSLHELRIHNTIDDHDLEQLPDSLRYLYLYSGYEQDLTDETLISLKQKKKSVSSSLLGNDNNIQILEMNPGRFGCSEPIFCFCGDDNNYHDDKCHCSMFKFGKGVISNDYSLFI